VYVGIICEPTVPMFLREKQEGVFRMLADLLQYHMHPVGLPKGDVGHRVDEDPRRLPRESFNGAMSEKKDEIRFTIRIPASLHNEIEERLKEQKKHFSISKNSYIVGLLKAALDLNMNIGFIAEDREEVKKEKQG